MIFRAAVFVKTISQTTYASSTSLRFKSHITPWDEHLSDSNSLSL